MFCGIVERGVAALVLVLANLNPASVFLMASSVRLSAKASLALVVPNVQTQRAAENLMRLR